MRRILLLTPLTWLALSGCGVTLGPVAERETIWATMGTPGRIVDKREVEVLVEGKRSRASLAGMVVLDEPTYQLLQATYEREKARTSAP